MLQIGGEQKKKTTRQQVIFFNAICFDCRTYATIFRYDAHLVYICTSACIFVKVRLVDKMAAAAAKFFLAELP